MKKGMLGILCIVLLIGLSGCGTTWERVFVNGGNSGHTYGIWLAYVDYPTLVRGKSEEEYRKSVEEIVTNAEALGINTIYMHASMFTDAMYESEYYPWSSYASGTFQKAPDYDPLEILTSEARLRKIKVEAWINPLRSLSENEMEALDERYPIKQWYRDETSRKRNLILVKDRYYLNPGSEDVKELIVKVVQELCTNYDLSGIHIDDYFYPAGIADTDDAITYEAYLEAYPDTSLGDYRRAQTSELVRRMYQAIKDSDRSLIFSISPSANVETNYNSYYADVKTWVSDSGYCDMIIPQVYFGFENETMPFEDVVDEWNGMVSRKVKLLFGLAGYKVGQEDEYAGSGKMEWVDNADVLSRQVAYLQKKDRYRGFVLYRYNALFHPDSSIRQQMKIELSKIRDMID